MTTKYLIRTIVLIGLLGPGFWVIRLGTFFILIFGLFGESAQGSVESQKAYDLFFVRHFPILLTLGVLIYGTIRKKLWSTDKQKLISNLVVGLAGIVIYMILERQEILPR
jgi:hypothetical protein